MHIGIIMDGNGRWAQCANRPRTEGHIEGAQALCRALDDISAFSEINCATFYAFSLENNKRNLDEVSNILEVIAYFLSKEVLPLAEKHHYKVRFIGNMIKMPKFLADVVSELNSRTINNKGKTIVFAIEYGGDDDVLQSVNRIVFQKLMFNDFTPITREELFGGLYTAGLPDIDIVIRYGGYKRLSNFLPLQCAYSELFFMDKMWPDYTKSDLQEIIKQFKMIKRNFGGLYD